MPPPYVLAKSVGRPLSCELADVPAALRLVRPLLRHRHVGGNPHAATSPRRARSAPAAATTSRAWGAPETTGSSSMAETSSKIGDDHDAVFCGLTTCGSTGVGPSRDLPGSAAASWPTDPTRARAGDDSSWPLTRTMPRGLFALTTSGASIQSGPFRTTASGAEGLGSPSSITRPLRCGRRSPLGWRSLLDRTVLPGTRTSFWGGPIGGGGQRSPSMA